jgi:hypothetical protein
MYERKACRLRDGKLPNRCAARLPGRIKAQPKRHDHVGCRAIWGL